MRHTRVIVGVAAAVALAGAVGARWWADDHHTRQARPASLTATVAAVDPAVVAWWAGGARGHARQLAAGSRAFHTGAASGDPWGATGAACTQLRTDLTSAAGVPAAPDEATARQWSGILAAYQRAVGDCLTAAAHRSDADAAVAAGQDFAAADGILAALTARLGG